MTTVNGFGREWEGLTGRVLALDVLRDAEDDEQHAEEDKERDDAAVAPGVRGAAPLQRQQQAHDGGHENDGAHGVELLQPGREADGRGLLPLRALEEEEDDDGREPAQWPASLPSVPKPTTEGLDGAGEMTYRLI